MWTPKRLRGHKVLTRAGSEFRCASMLKSETEEEVATPEEDLGHNPSLLTTHGDNVILMMKVLGSKNMMKTCLMDRGWKG